MRKFNVMKKLNMITMIDDNEIMSVNIYTFIIMRKVLMRRSHAC